MYAILDFHSLLEKKTKEITCKNKNTRKLVNIEQYKIHSLFNETLKVLYLKTLNLS